ncbi:MAG: glucosamine inositolphosphorylceramide transferase family protein [Pyrinomonadaceae bacterium]
MQPQWVRRIIAEVTSSSLASIVLVVRNRRRGQEQESLFQRLWKRRRHLLYAVYTKLDNQLSSVGLDAFQEVSVEDLLAGVPVVEVEPISQKFTDRLSDEDLKLIRAYELDVALRFGFRILKGGVLQIARHGVWSYHHDDGRIYRGGPPGFWEVMKDDPVTGSMLQILNEDLDNGKVIYRSWAPTINRFSVKKNNNNYYWKSSAFVMRKLRELHENGHIFLEREESGAAAKPYSHRLYKTPTNSEMFSLSMGLGRRAAVRMIEKVLHSETWSLAYRFNLDPSDLNNTFYKFKNLLPPPGRFWADPFPVQVGENYFVFFEEFLYDQNKAHISVIELQKGRKPAEPVKVLERPYHLSYPFVFEWQGSHYMIPETGSNNTVELYRCRSFPYEWEFETVLLKANNPSDATLAEIEGRWWMFVNIEEPEVSVNWEELHLFYSDSPFGPWTPHRRNPVRSDVRNSRPAGRLFWSSNSLYRPAQDCSRRYGYATAINEVKRISCDDYLEEEVSRITPEWDRNVVGTHTLNKTGDLTVIDCLIKRTRLQHRSVVRDVQGNAQSRVHAEKENVLQLIHSFIQGGSERQMIQLTRLLLESGRYRVHVACLRRGGVLCAEVDKFGLSEIPEYPLTSFYDRNMVRQLLRFSAFLKERDIRLIQTHDYYSNIFGMAAAKLARVPVRIASRRETSGMRTSAQKRVERLAFRIAHGIVTNAKAVGEHLVKEGVAKDKINVVYNGLDLDRLAPRPMSRADALALLGLPAPLASAQRKFVTIVANLQHDVKDHPMFLRAAQRIHKVMPQATFLVAGEGELIGSARALAEELEIGGEIFFLGRCEHVPELLSISDVCVLSSKAEGFSNAILEYMAAARPVVATDVGGAREAIAEGQSGYLVASGDDMAMAERILALLRDPVRSRAMGETGRRIVEEKFSCESQLNKIEALYQRLLQRRHGAATVESERATTEGV